MREIKFKAWEGRRKEMDYINDLYWFEENGVSDGAGDGLYGNYKIMQYTGLKDKNCKEIYEGDIVECVDMHDSNIDYWIVKPPRYKVYWNDEWACFEITGMGMPDDISRYWEVIGNIYENPELVVKE